MRKAKKLHTALATFIAVSMLSVTPVWAADTSASTTPAPAKQEQANLPTAIKQSLDKVLTAIPELKTFTVVSHRPDSDNKTQTGKYQVYLLKRSDKGADKASKDKIEPEAFLSFDQKSGRLLELSINHSEWTSDTPPSEKLAKEKATAFLKTVLGDELDKLKVSEHSGVSQSGMTTEDGKRMDWKYRSVAFERLYNGIPLLSSGVHVSVDKSGNITAYYLGDSDMVYDDKKFPDPKEALSKEKAEEALQKLTEMNVFYISNYSNNQAKTNSKPVIAYAPAQVKILDAKTGKPVDTWDSTKPLTPKKVSISAKGEALKVTSKAEAEKLLSSPAFGLDLSKLKYDEREEKDSYTGNTYVEYSWSSHTDDNKNIYINLSVNKATGEVIRMNSHDSSQLGKKGTLSPADAEKAALPFIEKYADSKVKELSLDSLFSNDQDTKQIPEWVDKSKLKKNEKHPQYYLTFSQLHQNIPVADKAYSVQVDALTGKIIGFHFGLQKEAALPDSKKIITAEQAKKAFVASHPVKLSYLWPQYEDQMAPAPLLVYILSQPSDSYFIDALTGEPLQ
ncbi:YcdB/YcdC domain-containing protein [Brevibacillus laterosporus]|uniref:YcdB/YcdC domain-containing protein n=1 Tax=Brevibacillus laterosporus TaxID=1465 RepID=UPI000EAD3447|nr:YcdB/YcdC domain-containing protein [Brevibacillus laterosporus]AYK05989.1 peptidase [Brevibacillus laterosporus]